jgi:hypothetical protein
MSGENNTNNNNEVTTTQPPPPHHGLVFGVEWWIPKKDHGQQLQHNSAPVFSFGDAKSSSTSASAANAAATGANVTSPPVVSFGSANANSRILLPQTMQLLLAPTLSQHNLSQLLPLVRQLPTQQHPVPCRRHR